jgi:short-subunit dehydrogenase
MRLSLLGRDVHRLETIAGTCRSQGCDVEAHAADVTDAVAMERWLLACDSIMPIDLVIANAGLGGAAVYAEKAPETTELACRIISVNTLGVINTVTPLLPRFVERRGGQIAIVSSLLAFLGAPACPAYSGSKAAIGIYGDGLRRLLAPQGIRITTVYPGFIDTPMSQSLGFQGLFVWSADRAAAHIARGLARGRREMLFPWPLGLVVRGLRQLPTALADPLLTRVHLAWVASNANARSKRGP